MRTGPFEKRIDFFELDSRFSSEQAINYEDIMSGGVSYEEVQPFLTFLPDREVDLIELYYKHRKNQKDIARMFGVTQGAVSSRLSRARTRLQFLRDLPKISDHEIDNRLGGYFDDIEREIIKCMVRTTCQSKTAEFINQKFNLNDDKRRMTQVKVRHRFLKCIEFLSEKMKKEPELKKYHDLLIYIKKNLYKLHEVKLPHFFRGDHAVFSFNM